MDCRARTFPGQLTNLLSGAGYRPTYIEVMRSAVCVWFWAGATAIQISRDVLFDLSDMRELATEIALEAQRLGVTATRY